jgi:broad specificity polyphosphatase/5'/3'-nucleotidase SurE
MGNSTGTVSRIVAATSSEAPSIAISLTMNSGRCSTLRRISARRSPTASRRAWSAK